MQLSTDAITPAALRLRPFRLEDENEALAAHEAMQQEGSLFLLDYRPEEPWSAYVERREANRRGEDMPQGAWWVPSTFLAATVGGELVGRVSVRHELNEWLAEFGGHIGYGVLPGRRRRGYATEILRQGLVVARSVGVDEVLLLCNVDNVASARTIEKCGGRFEFEFTNPATGESWRRYWIH